MFELLVLVYLSFAGLVFCFWYTVCLFIEEESCEREVVSQFFSLVFYEKE